MKLKKYGSRSIGGLLFLSFFLAPGVQAAHKSDEAHWYVNINRALMHVSDGFQKDTYFVDNYSKSSRAGIKGHKRLDDKIKVGGNVELEFVTSNSSSVSQLNKNATNITDGNAVHDGIKIRQVDTWIKSDFGKISLGHGSMASWLTVASDLSGTSDTVGLTGPYLTAGGMYFHVKDSPNKVSATTDPKVITVFSPYEGDFTRQSRLRYDSPKFAGFSISGSMYNGGNDGSGNYVKMGSDLALKYAGCLKGVKVEGAVAFTRMSKGSDTRNAKVWDGSIAALHVDSGLNFAYNIAQKTLANDVAANAAVDPNTYLITKKQKFNRVQLGIIADLNCYGSTNFVADYAYTKNAVENDAKGKGYGLGIVQKLNKINSEVYVSVRQLKFDRPLSNVKYDRMVAAMAGIKINFGGKLSS